MAEDQSQLKEISEGEQRLQKNEQGLKSLRNGQLIEMPTSEFLQFLKFVELTIPTLSFAFKPTNGITKLKIITHG